MLFLTVIRDKLILQPIIKDQTDNSAATATYVNL